MDKNYYPQKTRKGKPSPSYSAFEMKMKKKKNQSAGKKLLLYRKKYIYSTYFPPVFNSSVIFRANRLAVS